MNSLNLTLITTIKLFVTMAQFVPWPQSPPLTIGGTVLKETDVLVILGVIFDSKMTFDKHLRSVSRAASQRLGILRKSWRVFHDPFGKNTHIRCISNSVTHLHSSDTAHL